MAYTALIRPTVTGRNSHHGETHAYVGQFGKTLNPTDLSQWHKIGRLTSVPQFLNESNPLQITAGLTKALLLSIPQDQIKEQEYSFDFWGLQAMQMMLASDVAITVNYASDGQTTVASGGTKTSCTVTSATGLAVDDCVEISLEHATYGGFKEITYITKITGSVVEYEPLPLAPANSATFKKVAGDGTGTDETDTGIIIPMDVAVTYPNYQLLIVTNMSNEGQFYRWIPQFQVIGGKEPDFNEVIPTLSFKGNPIVQEPKSFDIIDGTTANRAYYGQSGIIPKES